MKLYVFGNEDSDYDKRALQVSDKLASIYKDITFVKVNPNENLPFGNEKNVIIMDVVEGISEVSLINNDGIDKLISPPRSTVHDFDLGFQLKYLKKLGKLGRVSILGLPMVKTIDYALIHSILRKLVAQDMQGS